MRAKKEEQESDDNTRNFRLRTPTQHIIINNGSTTSFSSVLLLPQDISCDLLLRTHCNDQKKGRFITIENSSTSSVLLPPPPITGNCKSHQRLRSTSREFKNEHHIGGELFPASKLIATTMACFAAACLSYPAEMFRLNFVNKAYSAWDFENMANKNIINNSSNTFVNSNTNNNMNAPGTFMTIHEQQKQKIRVIVSPLLRLVSHEVALTFTTEVSNVLFKENLKNKDYYYSINEVTAGVIAGICQALILCPLEIHRANEVMYNEEKTVFGNSWKHWLRWTEMQLFEGGTGDPQERRTRAFRGIQTLALREMLFNISFFPLFHASRRYLDKHFENNERHNLEKDEISLWNKNRKTANMFISGALSGLVCSLAVTPADVFKTYMLFSREQWSLWSGKVIIGPSFSLLMRGSLLQAFVFGPTFGVVAAVYEMNSSAI